MGRGAGADDESRRAQGPRPARVIDHLLRDGCRHRFRPADERDYEKDPDPQLDDRLGQLVVDDRFETDRAFHDACGAGARDRTRSSSRFMSNGFSRERTPSDSAISRPALEPVVSTTGTSASAPPCARKERTSQPPSASGIMKSTSTSESAFSFASSTARCASPQEMTEYPDISKRS